MEKFLEKLFDIFGGSKKEKAEIGLVRLSKKFKYIVPSGILLNTILKVMF